MFGDLNENAVTQYDESFITEDVEKCRVRIIKALGVFETDKNKGKPYTLMTFESCSGKFSGARFQVFYNHKTEEIDKKDPTIKYKGGRTKMRALAIACGHFTIKADGGRAVSLDHEGGFDPIVLEGKELFVDIKAKKGDKYWNHTISNERSVSDFNDDLKESSLDDLDI